MVAQEQGGRENTQINGNGNNHARGNITINRNMVHDIKVSPRDIELKAIVNHDLVVGFVYVVCIIAIYMFLNTMLISEFLKLMISIVTGLFVFLLIDMSQKFMMKYSPWHISYIDGRITINGVERKFYEEIWNMQYKRSIIGNGIVSIYGVNPENNRPYHHKLKFMHDAEARYVYDSFIDIERIAKYKEKVHYAAP